MNDKAKTAVVEGREEKVLPMALGALNRKPESTRAPAPAPAPVDRTLALPLEYMLDVPVTLVFEIGRTQISVRELMELTRGAFVELRQVSVDSIDVRVDEEIIASGEPIAMKQRYGVRFGEVEKLPHGGDDHA